MADRPPLASLALFSARLGYTPQGDEESRATACLVDASELIRDVAGEDWLNGDETAVVGVPQRVEKICIWSAKRAFENTEALSQRTQGDRSQSYDRARREGGEAVYLTDAEQKAVIKAAQGSSFVAVTLVSPYSGDSTESLLGS